MARSKALTALVMALALAWGGQALGLQHRAPGTVDLAVPEAQMNITAPHPGAFRTNDNLSISILVDNLGPDEATNVTLELSYNTTSIPPALILTLDVGTIGPGSNATVAAYWNTSGLGLEVGTNYTLRAETVNDTNETDSDLSNNAASRTVSFLEDVVPVITDLLATTYIAVVGDKIGLEATVDNTGVRPAVDEPVSFYLDSAAAPFYRKNITVQPGSPETVLFWWDTRGLSDGNHTITAKVRQQSRSIVIAFKYRTNTYFQSITASTYSANVGDRVDINITLYNNGSDTEAQVRLNFYVDNGGVPIGNYTVDQVPAGTPTLVNYTWDTSGTQPGNHTLKARLLRTMREIHTATMVLGPRLLPDMAVVDFTISKTEAIIGEVLELNVTVANLGDIAPAGPVPLQLLLNSVEPIAEADIAPLAPDGSFVQNFKWNTSGLQERQYGLRAQIDPLSEFPDKDDSNNDLKLDIRLKGVVDLAVESLLFTRYQNLSTPITNITDGESLWVWATVANRGTVGSVPNTTLAIHLDGAAAPMKTFTLYSLAAGANFTYNFRWDTAGLFGPDAPMYHTLLAVVDAAQLNGEVDRSNNMLSAGLVVLPRVEEASLAVLELRPSKSTVRSEESVILTAHVANLGGTPAYNVTLRLTYNSTGSPQLIGDQLLAAMLPGEHQNRTMTWSVVLSEGSYNVTAVLDPQNTVQGNHSGNQRTTQVTVLPAQQQGPDVALMNFSWRPTAPHDGETVVVSLVLRNMGDTSAADLKVTFLVDGKPAGNETVTELAPGASRTVGFEWKAGTGEHKLGANVTGANIQSITVTDQNVKVAAAPASPVDYLPMIIVVILLLVIAVALFTAGRRRAPAKSEEEE